MEAADLLLWFRTISLALVGVVAIAFSTGINAASRSPGLAASPAHFSPPLGAGAGAAGGTVTAVAPALVKAGALQVVTHGSVVSAGQMSPSQLAGQRVIYSYSGLQPPASLLALIRQGRAAGVIFFGGNYRDSRQFRAAIRALEAANASTTNPARRYPLLLMTDQEGGEVNRLPGAPAPSEKQIGALRPLADADAAANLAGRGLNVDLSPVLDVYRTARDFDDRYQRSFSRDPAIVSALGARFISAMQARHVAATAKHFPGLGA